MPRIVILILLMLFSVQALGGATGVDISCLIPSIEKLAQHPAVIREVELYNSMEGFEPQVMDKRWPLLAENSPELEKVLGNPISKMLNSFIMMTSLQGEGLLIGLDGGLVAATGRTTDFWQGDETQFSGVMDDNYTGAQVIEAHQDESTGTMLIKVSVPIASTNNNKIGVLVIGLDAYIMNFRKLCEAHRDNRGYRQ